MSLLFWPRGGSAQVAAYLSRALALRDWDVTLAAGSLGLPGERGNAESFFHDINVAPFSLDAAQQSWEDGGDPMDSARPMHPSYEDRSGVSDRSFTDVSPAQELHAAEAARLHMRSIEGFVDSDVFHVHHLSALQLAARQAAPRVPIVTHLHGTELKLVEAISNGEPGAADHPHSASAVAMMRAAALESDATIFVSPHDRELGLRLLHLDPAETCVLPNGVDVERFSPQPSPTPDARRAAWRRWLVTDPQGWDSATGRPGSIAYAESDLDAFVDPATGEVAPVLLYVGRFLGFKRVPLLIRAYARALPLMSRPAPLVIWGGAPGEWEGEHPHDVARELGIEDRVFFAGWRGHDELPQGLAASDALVAPSVDEPFGQVYLEAMACGLPVVGTSTGGPLSFVNVDAARPDGWLVDPDSIEALTQALVDLVDHPDERRRRGANARRHAVDGYAWSSLATRFIEVYDSVRR